MIDKYRYKIKKIFDLPENAKVVFFRNPKEFNRFDIERINPNHKIILWGQLKKKHRYCKNAYKIMCGKIRIPLILILDSVGIYFLLNINLELVLTYSILSPIIVYYMLIYPLIKENKNVNRDSRGIRNRENVIINSIPNCRFN